MTMLLAISGSLRAQSSNAALLEAAALLAPDAVRVRYYRGIASLPRFNSDHDVAPPPPGVADLRAGVETADRLMISCPEYARGIPGSLNNGPDWLVSGPEMPGKPVALLNASPRASEAQAAPRLVLTTMSARLVEDASITLPLLARGAALRSSLSALVAAITKPDRGEPRRPSAIEYGINPEASP